MKRALVCVIVVACNRPVPTTVDASPVDASPATTSTCAATIASYESLVARGGACSADADCACFTGGVSQKTPCGGVTDRATATKLAHLATDYEGAKCDALMCAAFICTPACSAGKCVNGQEVHAAPPAASSSSWTSCKTDRDCTYVSLGCCDTTPVNRAHVTDAKQKLERSGKPYCPPKSPCGPSADGTWAGAPGKCSAGNCVLR